MSPFNTAGTVDDRLESVNSMECPDLEGKCHHGHGKEEGEEEEEKGKEEARGGGWEVGQDVGREERVEESEEEKGVRGKEHEVREGDDEREDEVPALQAVELRKIGESLMLARVWGCSELSGCFLRMFFSSINDNFTFHTKCSLNLSGGGVTQRVYSRLLVDQMLIMNHVHSASVSLHSLPSGVWWCRESTIAMLRLRTLSGNRSSTHNSTGHRGCRLRCTSNHVAVQHISPALAHRLRTHVCGPTQMRAVFDYVLYFVVRVVSFSARASG